MDSILFKTQTQKIIIAVCARLDLNDTKSSKYINRAVKELQNLYRFDISHRASSKCEYMHTSIG